MHWAIHIPRWFWTLANGTQRDPVNSMQSIHLKVDGTELKGKVCLLLGQLRSGLGTKTET